jgi:hypothetical protein
VGVLSPQLVERIVPQKEPSTFSLPGRAGWDPSK